MSFRLNEMSGWSIITCLTLLFSISYTYGQDCKQTIAPEARFNCYPENNPSQSLCEARGCCWHPLSPELNLSALQESNVSACYYPANYSSYEVVDSEQTRVGERYRLRKSSFNSTHLQQTLMNLTVDISFEAQQRLRIQIYDPNYPRYQVPLPVPKVDTRAVDVDYDVNIHEKPFGIIVTRKSTNETLFNSSIAPLIFQSQFLKISTQLPSPYLYGLGEHRKPFLINITESWQRFSFWTRDFPPIENTNLYGDHPFYINLGAPIDGHRSAHGQFLLNSNAMDIDLQPYPALSYTTIGGIIDLYIFTGPTPQNIIEQYWAVIGKPVFPPFWSLGFHLSRYGYKNIDNLKAVIQRMYDADFPYDVQWTDIDAMESARVFTYDKENFRDLPDLVQALKSRGQYYVNVFDAGISSTQPAGSYPPYDQGINRGVFIKKHQSDDPIIGNITAGHAAFPDFGYSVTDKWWADMITAFQKELAFDGMCLSVNEPSSSVDGSIEGCPNTLLDNPPYTPHVFGNSLKSKSLCASARQSLSQHYNLHSMFGYFESRATYEALKDLLGERPFVLSRSTFVGSGQFAAHWTGDNRAVYQDMYYSIPDILSFNMFGITHVGADICGYGLDTTEELCTRWMQLGAFYPFMRNHNDINQRDQDPASFSWETQEIMKKVLMLRYSLIPYWYTLHYEATTKAKPIIRPLFFEYMDDENTYDIDQQFLVGSAILVSPVLEQGLTSVNAYFPQDPWYDFSSGIQLETPGREIINLTAPIQKINVHVRGGFIIPMQTPGPTLILGRGNPFQLLVALSPGKEVKGNLYWDDGFSLNSIDEKAYNYFEFNVVSPDTLIIDALNVNYTESTMRLDIVKVFGIDDPVKNVTVDGESYTDFVYNFLDNVLLIHGLDMDLLMTKRHTIQWIASN